MPSGRMMYQPMSIAQLIDHAARYHGDTEIVSALTEGGFERLDWATVGANARRIASALVRRGMTTGDRIATLAWNNRRHLELYFGVPGAGMVCHTINPWGFPAKDRSGRLDQVEEPHLGRLMTKIRAPVAPAPKRLTYTPPPADPAADAQSQPQS